MYNADPSACGTNYSAHHAASELPLHRSQSVVMVSQVHDYLQHLKLRDECFDEKVCVISISNRETMMIVHDEDQKFPTHVLEMHHDCAEVDQIHLIVPLEVQID